MRRTANLAARPGGSLWRSTVSGYPDAAPKATRVIARRRPCRRDAAASRVIGLPSRFARGAVSPWGGPADSRLDQSTPDGIAHQARSFMDIKLLHDARAMRFRGLDADVKQARRLFRR